MSIKKNCELKLLKSINTIQSDFSIIAPLSKEKNFGFFYKKKSHFNNGLLKVCLLYTSDAADE